MISFSRFRELNAEYPEAKFALERAISRATGTASIMPDPEEAKEQRRIYLKPQTCPRSDRMEASVFAVMRAREKYLNIKNELATMRAELAEQIEQKGINGDFRQTIEFRYLCGYGISKIAETLLGKKTERERNRIKYILKVTENRINQ